MTGTQSHAPAPTLERGRRWAEDFAVPRPQRHPPRDLSRAEGQGWEPVSVPSTPTGQGFQNLLLRGLLEGSSPRPVHLSRKGSPRPAPSAEASFPSQDHRREMGTAGRQGEAVGESSS